MRARQESSLGECLASWTKDKGHILIALESYFDGSCIGRSWHDGSWLTLAGVAADDSLWIEFDRDWRRILDDDKRRPSAKYVHMKEAVHLEKEFSFRNGWNLTKVGYLVKDLLFYLSGLDKQKFRQFACTVDLSAYRKLQAEGLSMDDPVAMCNRYCPEYVLYWYANEYPGLVHEVSYFFDRKEPFIELFKKQWNETKDTLVHHSARLVLWDLIRTVAETDIRQKPPLQAADMLAWATNRQHSREENPFHYLSDVMKKVIPSSWILWDERTLRDEFQKSEHGVSQ